MWPTRPGIAVCQVCCEAAKAPVWQLRDGRMALLAQGCFVQPNADLKELGPAGLNFIQSALPLFNVPWSTKIALESAGVQSCSTVTPKSTRSARDLTNRNGSVVEGNVSLHHHVRGSTLL
jgi:hypothetical protein